MKPIFPHRKVTGHLFLLLLVTAVTLTTETPGQGGIDISHSDIYLGL